MADYNSTLESSSTNKMKNGKKKRKQKSTEINELEKEAQEHSGGPSKIPRIDKSEGEIVETNTKLEDFSPCRNLQLILFLQNEDIDLLKYVICVCSNC